MADFISYIIFFGLLLWKPKWVIGGGAALVLFCAGWAAIWNAITPFEHDTKTWVDRIVSAFWGVVLILMGGAIILTAFTGKKATCMDARIIEEV